MTLCLHAVFFHHNKKVGKCIAIASEVQGFPNLWKSMVEILWQSLVQEHSWKPFFDRSSVAKRCDSAVSKWLQEQESTTTTLTNIVIVDFMQFDRISGLTTNATFSLHSVSDLFFTFTWIIQFYSPVDFKTLPVDCQNFHWQLPKIYGGRAHKKLSFSP